MAVTCKSCHSCTPDHMHSISMLALSTFELIRTVPHACDLTSIAEASCWDILS